MSVANAANSPYQRIRSNKMPAYTDLQVLLLDD